MCLSTTRSPGTGAPPWRNTEHPALQPGMESVFGGIHCCSSVLFKVLVVSDVRQPLEERQSWVILSHPWATKSSSSFSSFWFISSNSHGQLQARCPHTKISCCFSGHHCAIKKSGLGSSSLGNDVGEERMRRWGWGAVNKAEARAQGDRKGPKASDQQFPNFSWRPLPRACIILSVSNPLTEVLF